MPLSCLDGSLLTANMCLGVVEVVRSTSAPRLVCQLLRFSNGTWRKRKGKDVFDHCLPGLRLRESFEKSFGILGREDLSQRNIAAQVGYADYCRVRRGGPFKEIIQSDIFINCIYLTQPIPPFVTSESLSDPSRKLSVVCDVSCDPNNPHNPVPIYDDWTTFEKPTLHVPVDRNPPLTVIAIGEYTERIA